MILRVALILCLWTVSVCAQVTPPGAVTAQGVPLTLTWTNNATNATNVEVERKTAPETTYTKIATVLASVDTYVDGSAPAATNCYRVRATNAVDQSAYSNEACKDFVATPVPVDCVLSAWGAWGVWVHVGAETTESRTRSRTVITPAANGGAACGLLTEQETRAWIPTPPVPAAPVLTLTTNLGFPVLTWTPPADGVLIHINRLTKQQGVTNSYARLVDAAASLGLWQDDRVSFTLQGKPIRHCYMARYGNQAGMSSWSVEVCSP